MEYRFDDRALHAEEFLRFVNQVWPGDYDPARTEEALGRTICLTARDNGCLLYTSISIIAALRLLYHGATAEWYNRPTGREQVSPADRPAIKIKHNSRSAAIIP